MIAKKNKYLEEASEALYNMNADETIRAQCRARADYYRLHNTINKKMDELESKVRELSSEKELLASEKELLVSKNDQLVSENDKLAFENDKLASQIEYLKKLLKENDIADVTPHNI